MSLPSVPALQTAKLDPSVEPALESERADGGDRLLDCDSPPVTDSHLEHDSLLPDSPVHSYGGARADFPQPDEMTFFDVGVVVAKSTRVPYQPIKMPSLQDVLAGASTEVDDVVRSSAEGVRRASNASAHCKRDDSTPVAASRSVSLHASAYKPAPGAAASAHAPGTPGGVAERDAAAGGEQLGEDSEQPLEEAPLEWWMAAEVDASTPAADLAGVIDATAGCPDEVAVADVVDRVCAALCSEARLAARGGGEEGAQAAVGGPPDRPLIVSVFEGRLSDPATMHALCCSLQILALQQPPLPLENDITGELASAAAPGAGAEAAISSPMLVEQAGGVRMLAQILVEHPRDAAVVEAAATALRDLATDTDCRLCVGGQAGVIASLVEALTTHGDDIGVVESVCGALQNIGANAEANKLAIAAAGGISALVNVLAAHIDSSSIIHKACGALQNISRQPDVKVAVARAGGIPLLAAVLRRHADVAAVCEQACGALFYLAHNQENQAAMGRAGCIVPIVAVLARHADSPAVLIKAAGALLNAVAHPGNKTAAVKAGALSLLVAALSRHGFSAPVAQWGCAAIWALTVVPEHADAAIAAGVLTALVQALSRHVAVASVAQWASGSLWNLASHSRACLDAVRSTGPNPWLSAIIVRHKGTRAAVNAEGLQALLKAGWGSGPVASGATRTMG